MLAALAAKMEPKEAASLGGRLVAVLEDPKETDADCLSMRSGRRWRALAAKMEPKEEAASLAGRLVTVLEDPKETDAHRLSTLAEALAELAAKMEPKEAAAVAGRGAQRLVGLLEDPKETDADRLSTLAEALAELAAKMEPKEAAAVAARGAQRLVGLLEDPKETDADRLATLGGGAGRAGGQDGAQGGSGCGGAWRAALGRACWRTRRIPPAYVWLGEALAGLAAKMEPKEAASLAGRLVTVLEDPKNDLPPVYAPEGAGRADGQDGAQGGSGRGGAWRAALGRLAGGPEGNRC